ncbi:MAG: hypothetical protein ABSG91_03375 [Syntrophobacteraceae bacterium]|jgi:hypothetical protein
MFSNILACMMLVWIAFYHVPACSAQPREPQGIEGGQFDTRGERIGGLRLGLAEKEVARNISCKPKKGKEVFEGATGEYVQMWKHAECGIVLKMGSERKGGKKVVESITVTGPGNLVTGRGIHIGSTEEEVIKVYGRYRDDDGGTGKGRKFVAGSIYDGMIFDFEDGRVVRIFLGAAAE